MTSARLSACCGTPSGKVVTTACCRPGGLAVLRSHGGENHHLGPDRSARRRLIRALENTALFGFETNRTGGRAGQ